MGWYSDMVSGVGNVVSNVAGAGAGDAVSEFLTNAPSGIAGAAIASEVGDYFQPDTPDVGYQGKIPDLTAVRERVPMQPMPQGGQPRRPGEAGRRYFSDVQYAARPTNTRTPTVEEARAAAQAQAMQLAQRQNPNAPVPPPSAMAPPVQAMAMGGIASAHNGYYLGGRTDGMADEVPASIDGTQEARLSDGEFVIPADVVSHLGNGNSDAGANQLHGMMDSVRKERTGNSEQGKQIDPNKFMPTMAQGGIAQAYNYGGSVYKNQPKVTNFQGEDDANAVVGGEGSAGTQPNDPLVGQAVGTESSLSSWAGDYVTDMLGQGKALGNQAYQAYEGPLSAGTSGLQDQSFEGIGALNAPTDMGAFTPKEFTAEEATAGMNPYLMAAINPQLDEARRQSEISRVANAGRMTQAGAFGGSRQALMDMENQRNLETNLGNITGKGYASAYDRAQQQFNTQQDRDMQAQNQTNKYGFDVIGQQQGLGAIQRGIESEGMAADYSQFQEERDYPYKQVQYMQSLLQGMPLEAQSVSYSSPSKVAQATIAQDNISNIYSKLFGG